MGDDEARPPRVIERLDPILVEFSDDEVFNVNAPEDVLHASALLTTRSAERERVRRDARLRAQRDHVRPGPGKWASV